MNTAYNYWVFQGLENPVTGTSPNNNRGNSKPKISACIALEESIRRTKKLYEQNTNNNGSQS